jgi:hypothetical protein
MLHSAMMRPLPLALVWARISGETGWVAATPTVDWTLRAVMAEVPKWRCAAMTARFGG